ncbi:MAG: nitroreductase family protein [Nitrososphaeraceae archaeon]
MLNPEITQTRTPTQEINPVFVNRWSPRGMTSEELDEDDLMALFEAARWAPSSYNNQPWRFIYAKRNTESWNKLFGLLVEGNKMWAKDSAALVVLVSRKNFEYNGKPSVTHQLDAGAAWEEATRARQELEIPEDYDVMAMIAIGKRGPKENLPPPIRDRESPSNRKPLKEIIMEGKYRP